MFVFTWQLTYIVFNIYKHLQLTWVADKGYYKIGIDKKVYWYFESNKLTK